ncbi:MAG: hypothetical protein ACRDQ7_07175 [Haloechinothrix sp.]
MGLEIGNTGGWHGLEVYAVTQGVNLLRATLSQHALGNFGWAFGYAIVLLAAGSVGILAGLVASGMTPLLSGGSLALLARPWRGHARWWSHARVAGAFVERQLALADIVAVLAVGRWAVLASSRPSAARY